MTQAEKTAVGSAAKAQLLEAFADWHFLSRELPALMRAANRAHEAMCRAARRRDDARDRIAALVGALGGGPDLYLAAGGRHYRVSRAAGGGGPPVDVTEVAFVDLTPDEAGPVLSAAAGGGGPGRGPWAVMEEDGEP